MFKKTGIRLFNLSACLLAIAVTTGSSIATAAEGVEASARAKFESNTVVKLPEGYRNWTHIGTYFKEPGKTTILDGSVIEGAQFGNTYVEPSALAAYKKTGKWPDGTQFVKDFTASSLGDECDDKSGVCTMNKGQKWPQDIESCDKVTGECNTTHGTGVFEAYYFGAGYMVKDAKRFPKAPGNWGYFGFGPVKGTPYPKTAELRPMEQCSGCHVANRADKDYVFSDLHLGLQQ